MFNPHEKAIIQSPPLERFFLANACAISPEHQIFFTIHDIVVDEKPQGIIMGAVPAGVLNLILPEFKVRVPKDSRIGLLIENIDPFLQHGCRGAISGMGGFIVQQED
jgi:hypothetical protein